MFQKAEELLFVFVFFLIRILDLEVASYVIKQVSFAFSNTVSC